MPARRCSTCSINFPESRPFYTHCKVCEGELSYFNNIEADEDWEESVAWGRRQRGEEYEDEIIFTPDPALLEVINSPYPHSNSTNVPMAEDAHGFIWVKHQELLDAGYTSLEDFDVVWSAGKFWELQGYKEGIRPGTGHWWVEQVPELEVPDSPEEETA